MHVGEGEGRFPSTQNLCRQLLEDVQHDVSRVLLQRYHTIFVNLQATMKSLRDAGMGAQSTRI